MKNQLNDEEMGIIVVKYSGRCFFLSQHTETVTLGTAAASQAEGQLGIV